ncbi:hypothetical protein APHAL10511_004803 [Amanita phalloides]|nr:hypothetical protein APHAL10511_004803 [Amanita phalloides]
MSFDLSSLEVHIRNILTSPNTNMALISAKGVRQRLVKLVPGFTAQYAKEHKDDLDAIIARVYSEVCNDDDEEADDAEGSLAQGVEKTRKRKQESDEENTNDDDEAEDRGDSHKKVAEEDEGGKPKVRKGGRASGNGTSKKVGRPKKSAATVESEAESDEGGKKKRKKKKTVKGEGGGGAKGGFAKEFPLSEPLAKVVGVERLSRPQVVKKLWVYIKEKGLQNPQNGKEILLDDNLKSVFGVDKIDMFAMNKALGQHLRKE